MKRKFPVFYIILIAFVSIFVLTLHYLLGIVTEYLADYEFDSIHFDTTICPWSVNHSEFSTNINMLLLLKIYMEISLVGSSALNSQS